MDEDFVYAIEKVSEQLGMATEHIYQVMVDAQCVVGIVNIVGMVVSLVVSVTVGIIVYKKLTNPDDDAHVPNIATSVLFTFVSSLATPDDDVYVSNIATSLLFMFVTALATGACMVAVSTPVLRILCPEYTAICQIVEMVIVK